MEPVFVTGGTGRVGREVIAQLLAAGVPVRALTRRPETADLPPAVELVAGDLTVPESLESGLRGVGSVFLLWTAPVDERDIAAVAARALSEDGHAGGDYVLTGPESLSHAEQVSLIGEAIGRELRFEEMSPDEFRRGVPAAAADMLLAAWSAALGRPAYVTSAVEEILGSPARTYRQWAADHADAFRPGDRVVSEG